MDNKAKPINLDNFEREQRNALRFCQALYGCDEPLERPTECAVPGCDNPYIYNSGMCTEHAF